MESIWPKISGCLLNGINRRIQSAYPRYIELSRSRSMGDCGMRWIEEYGHIRLPQKESILQNCDTYEGHADR
jgi:hypothetical protein